MFQKYQYAPECGNRYSCSCESAHELLLSGVFGTLEAASAQPASGQPANDRAANGQAARQAIWPLAT